MEKSSDLDDDGVRLFGLISEFLGDTCVSTSNRLLENTSGEVESINLLLPEAKGKISNYSHRIVIFSKDRPWQLQQLLRSMDPTNDGQKNNNNKLHIFIIINVSNKDFRDGYSSVKQEYEYLNISWLYESKEENSLFAQLFEIAIFNDCTENESGNENDLIMFLTDDCLLLEPVQSILHAAEEILQKSKRVLGFLARLHPGISYCQTKDEACPLPRSHLQYHQSAGDLDAFIYPMQFGRSDFAYPFDLSGGVYCKHLVSAVVKEMRRFHSTSAVDNISGQLTGYSHPNKLEINGNKALARLQQNRDTSFTVSSVQRDLLSFPCKPALVILAINRVQDICQAPLAITSQEDDISLYSPEALLKYLQDGRHLDITWYRACAFNSSHIGKIVVEGKNRSCYKDGDSFALSVLIPVHIGPPNVAEVAMKSLLSQILDTDADCIVPMQIVIVGDRCVDGSIDEMLRTAASFSTETGISLYVRDRRDNHIESQIDMHTLTIDVITSTSPGVGNALQQGLEYCEAELVARFDADDIMSSNRLVSQVKHFRTNPGVSVLGASCIMFSESKETSHSSLCLPYRSSRSQNIQYNVIGSSVEPTDAGFVAWAMMFSCVVPHPCTMFRQKKILAVGGYRQTDAITCTEDYDLWLRVIKEDVKCIYSLPIIGIFHRKQNTRSPSDERKIRQRFESVELSLHFISELCGASIPSYSRHLVAALKQPDEADAEILDGTAALLSCLEANFLNTYGSNLTKNEIDLIKMDCDARIGELATFAIQKLGRIALSGRAWELWCDRCPDSQLERLALVLHSQTL
jgi:glycosyltransferase involved in cell wall biosynthesis